MRLRFITNRDAVSLPAVRINTPTGTMAVSTPEQTALDLASRLEHGGALHNVATVLADLARAGQLDDTALSQLAGKFPAATGRRLGWVVEQFTELRLDVLAGAASVATGAPSKLDQRGPRRGKVDARWRVRDKRSGGTRLVIPQAAITHWSRVVPWPSRDQVEQDLVLGRLVCEIANHPLLGAELVFRGGTCLHKALRVLCATARTSTTCVCPTVRSVQFWTHYGRSLRGESYTVAFASTRGVASGSEAHR